MDSLEQWKRDQRNQQLLMLNEVLACPHAKYAEEHCAQLMCPNYYNRCFRHAYSGSVQNRCSRDDD